MSVVKNPIQIHRYIGLSTDTKPTHTLYAAGTLDYDTPIGSTFLEYDTELLYITYDGNNWVRKGNIVQSQMKEVRVTKALAAAGAYADGDILSESASAGTDWDFANIVRVNGGYGVIHSAMVISESEAIAPAISLYLFNAAPTCGLNDNVAAALPTHGDLAKFIGVLDFMVMTHEGDDSFSVITPSTVGNLPLAFKAAAASRIIYGVAVTNTAFTQTATDDLTFALLVEQL